MAIYTPFETPDTGFPPLHIVLLNGETLECYPRTQPPSPASDDDRQFFVQHAFFFLQHAPQIFQDSRMFLAPVPMLNDLAYTGHAGIDTPTLGVYLEWWLHSQAPLTHDRHHRDALTYCFAGSPLSGANHCWCVYPDGRERPITHPKFNLVWGSFMRLNQRYASSVPLYEAYTLRQVHDLLVASDP